MVRRRRITGTLAAVAAALVGVVPLAQPVAAGPPGVGPLRAAEVGPVEVGSVEVGSVAPAASVRTGGAPLNIRNNASTWNPPVGQLANGAPVTARCQLDGETISGSGGTSSLWLHLGDGQFVSGAYVAWRGDRPDLDWCDQPADPAPDGRAAFIEWAAGHAADSYHDYGVPVSVTIAQAINESGWGGSALTTQGNSYFGIKCFGIPGPLAAGCRPYATSECDDSGCAPTTATFRVYRSAARSFADHGRFLTVNPRYQPAFAHTGDPDRFAREIHRAGYATDPDYSDKLIGLMRAHDLYRFDR